jgi:hypothetical protein
MATVDDAPPVGCGLVTGLDRRSMGRRGAGHVEVHVALEGARQPEIHMGSLAYLPLVLHRSASAAPNIAGSARRPHNPLGPSPCDRGVGRSPSMASGLLWRTRASHPTEE